MILSVLREAWINIKSFLKVKIFFSKHFEKNVFIRVKGHGKIRIGKRSTIYSNVNIVATNNGNICIGNHVSINRNTVIICHEKITIGDDVGIGPNVCIYDHDHKFDKNGKGKGYRTGAVEIGNNVWIGAGTIILRNTKIGDNSVIGAGCIVKGDIPPNSLVKSNRELVIEPLR